MSITYTNRKGKTFYLYQGRTKKGMMQHGPRGSEGPSQGKPEPRLNGGPGGEKENGTQTLERRQGACKGPVWWGVLWGVLIISWSYAETVQPLPPAAKPALDLHRGICIDRQFRTFPPEPMMRITPEDLHLIASMGFEFVKFLLNPEPLMAGSGLDQAKQEYVQEWVGGAVREGLGVVVCIHPEWAFKQVTLSDPAAFSSFLGFLADLGQFMAPRWGPRQLAWQLMTEPGGNTLAWNDLLPQMWQTARKAMPEHTLILAGDQVGQIEGLVQTRPVNDENVLYSFTFYEPFPLTWQGAEWLTPSWWSHLGLVPYPSSPEIMALQMPAVLEKIPAADRSAVEEVLKDYGRACWDRDKIAARFQKVVDWNQSYGGRLKIWCAEFGCYQRTIDPATRYQYLQEVREALEKNGIGWAYWSYNETFTVMTPQRQPFGPAQAQIPDAQLLEVLLGRDRPRMGLTPHPSVIKCHPAQTVAGWPHSPPLVRIPKSNGSGGTKPGAR